MFGTRDKVSLFGRFKAVPKRRLARVLSGLGTTVQRDLTRSSTHLVIGENSASAFETVTARLSRARARGIRVLSETELLGQLAGGAREAATVPASTVPGQNPEFVGVLHAFGLITLEDQQIAFKDAETLRTAAGLLRDGLSEADTIKTLLDRRESPKGRHRVVVSPSGTPMLEWEDGVTTLSGQRMLDLDEGDDLEDLFEQALEAEALGDLRAAARLFETCAQNDRKDALAAFNLGNVRWSMADQAGAKLAFQQAIARDPRLSEAHYNIAGVLEQMGDAAAAKVHLHQALAIDDRYVEALFNLAQLELAAEAWPEARTRFQRFLELGPHHDLASKARQALKLIAISG